MKPLLLDGCCCAGGAAAGYKRAGFYVIGCDVKPQPRYAGDEFVQMDVFDFIQRYATRAAAIHVSPPCQAYSILANKRTELRDNYPMLISQVRTALMAIGKPYIIENVPGALLLNPITLCGYSFGLRVFKHRAFESNVFLMAPAHIRHRESVKEKGAGYKLAVYTSNPARMATVAGHMFSTQVGRAAMGIDWMNRHELAEAIPPVYTEWIGAQLMRTLEVA